MFVMSFPPLFGQEIVAILCGDVWGLGIGFGIVAAGTVLGELGNFYAFRWCCTARGKKFERDRLTYALYAQVTREGGLVVPAVMRLSFIPSHFLTAIFSTCGMNVWVFLVAATLSLPKQLATVFIGAAQSDGKDTPVTRAIKAVVVLATTVMTYLAMRYINRKVDEVKVRVVYARRKARQARALERPPDGPTDSTLSLPPEGAAAELRDIPLDDLPAYDEEPRAQSQSTSKSKRKSKGIARTILHMPRPQRAVSRESFAADTHRPQRLRAFLHGRGAADGRAAGAGASGSGNAAAASVASSGDSSRGSGVDEEEDAWESKGGASARDVEVIEFGGRESALRARKHTGDFPADRREGRGDR
ncbi:hypothetical protein ONZ51_g3637 [Trametes cubensis]|uniref:Golgi apparatus membrane protein TVP38 n=1 Tax=Trametes cubensis TaxID=1111947 RepID=A0AAD7TYE9_9APHY|nr:hypothetical protein ONZ51_g3637 [Trametes cubensis]